MPESDEFKALSHTDKKLVYQLRSATDVAKDKLDQLRNEMDEKERTAARESAMRAAAEERLDQLVDMYGNPAVTEELRNRLPLSAKHDTRITWQAELEEMKDRERSRSKESRSRSEDRSPMRRSSKYERRRSHSPPGIIHNSSPYDNHGMFPPQPPYPPYYNQHYPPAYPVPNQPMMYMVPAQGVPNMTQTSAPITAAVPDSTIPKQPTNQEQAPTTSSNQNPQQAVKDMTVHREQTRQISLLLAELDAARDLNKKVHQKLAASNHELAALKVSQQTREAIIEANATKKGSDLVEEIYRAQKQREEAIMGRLKLANEERDEALLKLRNHRTSDMLDGDDGGDADGFHLKDVLVELDTIDANVPVEQQGRHLVDAINRRKQRQRQITTEEMKVVLEERDSAMAKCTKLESDVMRLTRQVRAKIPDKQQQATLQARLLATQQERDVALSQVHKISEELQTLRVYYSLHKSLSQEANLRDQFHNTLETYEGQIKHRDTIMDQAHKDNNQLISQLKSALQDKVQMEAQVSKASNSQRYLQEQNAKLEKIVSLLRERVKDVTP